MLPPDAVDVATRVPVAPDDPNGSSANSIDAFVAPAVDTTSIRSNIVGGAVNVAPALMPPMNSSNDPPTGAVIDGAVTLALAAFACAALVLTELHLLAA